MANEKIPQKLAAIRRRIAEKYAPNMEALAAEGARMRELYQEAAEAYADLDDALAVLDPTMAERIRRALAIHDKLWQAKFDRVVEVATTWHRVGSDEANALDEVADFVRKEVSVAATDKQHAERRRLKEIWREKRFAEHRATAQHKGKLRKPMDFAMEMSRECESQWKSFETVYRLVLSFDREFGKTRK